MKKMLIVMLTVLMVMACTVPIFADGPGKVMYKSTLWSSTGDGRSGDYQVPYGPHVIKSPEEVFGTTTIDGYDFSHWEFHGARVEVGDTIDVNSTYPSRELYARWEKSNNEIPPVVPAESKYALIYDGNITPKGEDDVVESLPSDANTYDTGDQTVISSQQPTNKYRTFLGWSLDKDAAAPDRGLEAGAENATVIFGESDITLYAVWEINEVQRQYKVTYVLDPALSDTYVLKNNGQREYTEYKSIDQKINAFGVWAKSIVTQEQYMDVTMTLLNDCKGINGDKDFTYNAGTVVSVRESATVIKVNYSTEGEGKGFGFCNWEEDSEIRIQVSLNQAEEPEGPTVPEDTDNPETPITPIAPITPVTPVTPIVPIEPVTPVDPVNPEPLPDDEYLEDPANPEPLPEDEHLEDSTEVTKHANQTLPGDEHLVTTDGGNQDQPKTGDTQNLTMWISMLLIAIAGMGTLLLKKFDIKGKQ